MPVRKFRSVADMDGPAWHEQGDPRLFDAMRALWDLAARTLQPHFPPGVHKHRSIKEMNARSDAWAEANFSGYRERLTRAGEAARRR
jgi:hypothetical protein